MGTGPAPVIALHDWQGDHGLYRQASAIVDRGRFTYAFADARGCGRSKGLPGAFTVSEMAADILHLGSCLGWDRFHLVGHSISAEAVERAAIMAPERVLSLTLLAPLRLRGRPVVRTPDLSLPCLLEALGGPNAVLPPPLRTMTMREAARRAGWKRGPRAAYLRSLEADFPATPSHRKPRLVLVGAEDRIVDIDAVADQVARDASTLKVFDGAGHFFVDDHPAGFVHVLQAFLTADA